MEGLGVIRRVPHCRLANEQHDGLCRDFDVLDLTRAIWDGKSVFAQAFDVEDDSFADLGFNFRDRGSRGYTARKIGDIRRVVTFGFLNDDGVAHMTSRLQTGLLLNTVQCAGSQIIARLAGNSDATRLARVLKLAMTSASCDQVPTIDLEHSENFADFHEGNDSRTTGYRAASASMTPNV